MMTNSQPFEVKDNPDHWYNKFKIDPKKNAALLEGTIFGGNGNQTQTTLADNQGMNQVYERFQYLHQ